MKMKEKIEIRKEIKKKKPRFKRQEYKRKGLKDKWRKPRGIRSKMRMRLKGKSSPPNPGYGSPSGVRGLDREGMKEVLVYNPSGLEGIKKDEEIAVISGTVGKKKRLEILENAEKRDIRVKNK